MAAEMVHLVLDLHPQALHWRTKQGGSHQDQDTPSFLATLQKLKLEPVDFAHAALRIVERHPQAAQKSTNQGCTILHVLCEL